MKSVLVNFGEGVRVLRDGEDFLRLVFSVNTDRETIEVITLSKSKDIEVLEGFLDE